MKQILLFAALLIGTASFAQEEIAMKDIPLKEVVVKNKKVKKVKLKKVKYKGTSWCIQGIDSFLEIVTLVDKLPKGKIYSVKLDVNDASIIKFEQHLYDLKDTEVEMTFYEVNADGTPGKAIDDKSKIFTVKKEDNGDFIVNVASLDLYSPGKFYVGIKRLKPNAVQFKNEFVMTCVCENSKYTSMYRRDDKSPWQASKFGLGAIKMDVSVAVDK